MNVYLAHMPWPPLFPSNAHSMWLTKLSQPKKLCAHLWFMPGRRPKSSEKICVIIHGVCFLVCFFFCACVNVCVCVFVCVTLVFWPYVLKNCWINRQNARYFYWTVNEWNTIYTVASWKSRSSMTTQRHVWLIVQQCYRRDYTQSPTTKARATSQLCPYRLMWSNFVRVCVYVCACWFPAALSSLIIKQQCFQLGLAQRRSWQNRWHCILHSLSAILNLCSFLVVCVCE